MATTFFENLGRKLDEFIDTARSSLEERFPIYVENLRRRLNELEDEWEEVRKSGTEKAKEMEKDIQERAEKIREEIEELIQKIKK